MISTRLMIPKNKFPFCKINSIGSVSIYHLVTCINRSLNFTVLLEYQFLPSPENPTTVILGHFPDFYVTMDPEK